ncbi:hypothetical protein IHC87_11850 [Photobacterium damselae subsp. damselae]|uniref:hypothetical protein n=1 Tax=Photobacterium damselae TaxID=38293 RepID=UPI0010FDB97C|nr:hypothetical protein [Photobacterium damselae]TLS69748.1 hypothetical protein FD718_10935 [Photobacterium damselae subsp. damselae]UJZ93338.1 hypothetical protein IHC87_11850 [Photobacterium damselae subsp. damselae]UJZ97321.1 hypothetical protein IHC88_11830 [Photobacterium damselae subsp. damselae]
MKENHLTLLCEHYKNVVNSIKKEIEKRDKFFLFMLIVILGLMIQIADQDLFTIIFKRLTGINDDSIINKNIMSTLLWGLTLFIFIRYSQTCSTIEREYLYLKEIETKINYEYDGDIVFKLESSFYKDKKNHIRNTNKIIFKIIFPVMFLIAIFIKSYNEFYLGQFNLYTYLNCGIAIVITHNIIFSMLNVNKGQ